MTNAGGKRVSTLDAKLDYVIDSLRRYTAIRAWVAEILLIFAILMMARLAAAVWDGIAVNGEPLWFAWWQAYDNAGSYADDAVALANLLTSVIEGTFMFLAKKRIAIAREDGREEGLEEGRAELEPIIRDLQARIQRLENGGSHQSHASESAP